MHAFRTLGFAAALLSTPAIASVTYEYTGNPYTSVFEVDLGTHQTAQVVFSDLVTPDFTGTVSTAEVLSTSLTSGAQTLRNTDPGAFNYAADFVFEHGVPVTWTVHIQTIGVPLTRFFSTINSFAVQDAADIFAIPGFNSVEGNPGIWTRLTPAPVPLPASLWLLGASGALLGVCRKRVV